MIFFQNLMRPRSRWLREAKAAWPKVDIKGIFNVVTNQFGSVRGLPGAITCRISSLNNGKCNAKDMVDVEKKCL